MTLFVRQQTTYDVRPGAVDRILEDPANPLYRVAETIPDGSRILDIGAGNGLLGQVLAAARTGVVLDGLEPNPYAAKLARPHYRRFYEGYLQEHLDQLRVENYDFLVLADVIEHVTDPLALLRALRLVARENSRIVISVPNVAFGALRLALLEGRWEYVDSGLLERTHLRYFTRATLMQVFSQADLGVEREVFHQKSLFGSEIPVKRTLRTLLNSLALRRDELALTYQFFYVLAPGPTVAATPERFGHRTTVADILAWYGSPRRLIRASSMS